MTNLLYYLIWRVVQSCWLHYQLYWENSCFVLLIHRETAKIWTLLNTNCSLRSVTKHCFPIRFNLCVIYTYRYQLHDTSLILLTQWLSVYFFQHPESRTKYVFVITLSTAFGYSEDSYATQINYCYPILTILSSPPKRCYKQSSWPFPSRRGYYIIHEEFIEPVKSISKQKVNCNFDLHMSLNIWLPQKTQDGYMKILGDKLRQISVQPFWLLRKP